jgi:hypothetical protein
MLVQIGFKKDRALSSQSKSVGAIPWYDDDNSGCTGSEGDEDVSRAVPTVTPRLRRRAASSVSSKSPSRSFATTPSRKTPAKSTQAAYGAAAPSPFSSAGTTPRPPPPLSGKRTSCGSAGHKTPVRAASSSFAAQATRTAASSVSVKSTGKSARLPLIHDVTPVPFKQPYSPPIGSLKNLTVSPTKTSEQDNSLDIFIQETYRHPDAPDAPFSSSCFAPSGLSQEATALAPPVMKPHPPPQRPRDFVPALSPASSFHFDQARLSGLHPTPPASHSRAVPSLRTQRPSILRK